MKICEHSSCLCLSSSLQGKRSPYSCPRIQGWAGTERGGTKTLQCLSTEEAERLREALRAGVLHGGAEQGTFLCIPLRAFQGH